MIFYSTVLAGLLTTTSSFEENFYCSAKYDCHFNNGKKTYVNTLCAIRTWISRDDPTHDLEGERSGAASLKAENVTKILSYTQKKDLLMSHNKLRTEAASGKRNGLPSAADMSRITWDITLERFALAWALEAIGGHDMCRSQPDVYPQVGQNIALFGPNEAPNFDSMSKQAFTEWEKELVYLNKIGSSIIDSYKITQGTENASQLLWAATSKMGCSEVAFSGVKKRRKPKNWYTFLVCNYGPGNSEGKSIYLKGKPCSRCPAQTSCQNDKRYPNLCSSKDEDFTLVSGEVSLVHHNCLRAALFALFVLVTRNFALYTF